jgi:hypothetical protein
MNLMLGWEETLGLGQRPAPRLSIDQCTQLWHTNWYLGARLRSHAFV